MSLVHKPEMTEKNLSAHQLNGPRSRGPVTRAGKARAAAANLRHGFYSKEQGEAMLALGENPKDYARLLISLENNLAEGLEGELVTRITRALWRMRRAERMQDGLAAKRLQSGLKMGDLATGMNFTRVHDVYLRLVALSKATTRPDYFPSAAEILAFEKDFGTTPPEDIKDLFRLLHALGKLGPASASRARAQINPAAEGQAVKSARAELETALFKVAYTYDKSYHLLLEQCAKVRSPENIAALMAPTDESAMVMQKMEDASLHQLWRLTNVLFKVRNGALSANDTEHLGASGARLKSERAARRPQKRVQTRRKIKNTDCSGDVYENKGQVETENDSSGDLHENKEVA
jgi:hypothetical protein